MGKAPHQRALDVLVHRCGQWSRVSLSDAWVCLVYDVAWGFDLKGDVAHITTNISPGPSAEHDIDFFHTNQIVRIDDPYTGAILFEQRE